MACRQFFLFATAAILAQPVMAAAQTCPEPLRDARRLVLVTAAGMSTSAATVQLFQRATPDSSWRPASRPMASRIGRAGMAWGEGYVALRQSGEPVKVERDKRSPAGIYRIGHSFGFSDGLRRGHVRVTPQTVCVDDTRSAAYNTITSRWAAGEHAHVERMHTNANYREGLFVEYPTNAAARAGSCIFIHVWRTAAHPTTGCVALPEARVKALQAFAADGAVIAILPREALPRLPGCLPMQANAAIN